MKIGVYMRKPALIDGVAQLGFALRLPGPVAVHVKVIVIQPTVGRWLTMLAGEADGDQNAGLPPD